MARDPFLWPSHEDDPVNLPLGSAAVYGVISESNWHPATNTVVRHPSVFAIGLIDASDPTRKVYHYNGAAWVQLATTQIPDSLAFSSDGKTWSGTAENPVKVDDYPLDLVAADKTIYTVARRVWRYSDYLSAGGTPIAGLVNNDLVIVHATGANPLWKTGLPLLLYCWQSIDSSLPGIGAMRGTKIGGCVREGQMTTAYGIKHALLLAVNGNQLNGDPPFFTPGTRSYVWPNNGADGGPWKNYGGTGNLYLGSRIALPTSYDLTTVASAKAALSLEIDQGVEIARAFQDYGGYIVETTGLPATGQSVRLFGQHSIISQDLGGWNSATHQAWDRDLLRVLAQCQIVTNNHDDGVAPAGNIPGGSTGTLRQPKAESFTETTPIPAAPTSLTLESATGSSLTAQWDASGVLGETGFDIQHRTVPGSYPGSPQITTVVPDAESHVVTGLSAGDYAAQIRSKNTAGESAWSNEATGTVPTGQIGRTVLTSGNSDTDGTSFSTASYTPTANKLVLAEIQARTVDGTVPNTPTLSGNGLTWVLVASVGISTFRKLFLFRTLGASPSAGVLTIDFGAQSQTSCAWSIEEISGIDTSGTNGSGAVVQSATGSIN